MAAPTVRPHRRLGDHRQLLAGVNIPEDSVFHARHVLVTILEHGLKAVRHSAAHCDRSVTQYRA